MKVQLKKKAIERTYESLRNVETELGTWLYDE